MCSYYDNKCVVSKLVFCFYSGTSGDVCFLTHHIHSLYPTTEVAILDGNNVRVPIGSPVVLALGFLLPPRAV